MTLDVASDIVAGYSKALWTPFEGVARYATLLPAAPREIVHASKLTLASAIQQRRITREMAQAVECCIAHLPSFVEDARATRINRTQKLLIQKQHVTDAERAEYTRFTTQMFSLELMQEINDFLRVLAPFDPDDPTFWDIATHTASNRSLQPPPNRCTA